MATNLVPKSSEIFYCKKCDYTTSRKSQYQRHLLTAKHKNQQMATDLVPKSSAGFTCKCGKNLKTVLVIFDTNLLHFLAWLQKRFPNVLFYSYSIN